MQNKPRGDDELKECPRLKEGDLDKASRMYKGKNRSGM